MSCAETREIAVVIPTWNRSKVAMQAIDSVMSQDSRNLALHLIVVDNASNDDTFERLSLRFPEADVITNRSHTSHHIELVVQRSTRPFQRTGNLASVTLVRNTVNLGGSGGFNAGMAVARDVVCKGSTPFAIWLLDDDACPTPHSLSHLIAALDADPRIGLAGSRSVDPRDGLTTLETTVFFHPTTGHLSNHPEPHDPRYAAHNAWVQRVGDCVGKHHYSGIIDTDVCAACSVLARWPAFLKVGLWDHRFFIYEDDVDWSLRFASAGYRVVCALDAQVLHLTWHQKLTPTLIAQRLFYVQRNRTWLLSRHHDAQARASAESWLTTTLYHGLIAALHRRLVHADSLLHAAECTLQNRGGKLQPFSIPPETLASSAQRAGMLQQTCRVAVICDRPGFTRASRVLRDRIIELRGIEDGLDWTECVASDLKEPPSPRGIKRLFYSRSLRSRLARQLSLFFRPPQVVVIFDQAGDFPILFGSTTLHCSSSDFSHGWIEIGSAFDRFLRVFKWARLRFGVPAFLAKVAPGSASQPEVKVLGQAWR